MKFRKNLQLTAVIVFIPWLVYIINFAMPVDLRLYGLRPRQLEGLWGILFSPFLHGNLNHLIANTGAYGRVMSSRYNRREPAGEVILP